MKKPKEPRRDFFRTLIGADNHGGHLAGLTPPGFWYPLDNFLPNGEPNVLWNKVARLQRFHWEWFTKQVDTFKPYDAIVWNGDAIAGKAKKSGGTELISSDRTVQLEIAAAPILYADCPTIFMTAGTGYHTGDDEDWEAILAKELKADFNDVQYLEIYGKRFNFRHHNAASGVPHGTLTPLAKEVLQNRQWVFEGVEEKADVIVRSHTHRYDQIDHDDCLCFSTASLQGLGDKYGSRRVGRVVHFGILVIDVYRNGEIKWYDPKLKGGLHKVTYKNLTP